jgi:sugar lactone lactonase YvrE
MKRPASHQRTKVFISYSHQDRKWLERLRRHLRPLERDHAIEIWDDTKIEAGANWRAEIGTALQSAKVAILLVSADFLASEFIVSEELPRLLAAADQDGAIILPLIVSPCRFIHTESLSKFQAVNSPTKPLIRLDTAEREDLFVTVSEEIVAALAPLRQTAIVPAEPKPGPRTKKSATTAKRIRQPREPPPVAAPVVKPVRAKPKRRSSSAEASASVQPSPGVQVLEIGDKVNSVAFSPDGEFIASGTGGEVIVIGKNISICRVSNGKIRTFEGHNWRVLGVAFSPDGTVLASASSDKTIKLWRVADGKEVSRLEGHTDGVSSVAFSPDGGTLVSGSFDQTVRLWNINDGKHRVLRGHANWVNSVAYSPDGELVASGSGMPYFGGADNSVRLWQTADGSVLRKIETQKNVVWSVAFSPDGSMLASASRDKSVMVWRVADGKHLFTCRRKAAVTEQVKSVAFSPDSEMIAYGSGAEYWSAENILSLVAVPDGKLIRDFEGHQKAVTSVSFSPDGTILASGSYDQTVRLWKL